ncbi:hypothetical protein BDZ91DRAFT_764212 [Kalaharituber pfeilii]|nr:hypothetical protein BDZ91DRAFT_764212 [Kalaharituber pfeilii]
MKERLSFGWAMVLASLWKHYSKKGAPTPGSTLAPTEAGWNGPSQAGLPLPPPPPPPPPPSDTLVLSPISNIDTAPVQPTTDKLGFSTITTKDSEEPSTEQTPGTMPTSTPGPRPKKRKGKTASA